MADWLLECRQLWAFGKDGANPEPLTFTDAAATNGEKQLLTTHFMALQALLMLKPLTLAEAERIFDISQRINSADKQPVRLNDLDMSLIEEHVLKAWPVIASGQFAKAATLIN